MYYRSFCPKTFPCPVLYSSHQQSSISFDSRVLACIIIINTNVHEIEFVFLAPFFREEDRPLHYANYQNYCQIERLLWLASNQHYFIPICILSFIRFTEEKFFWSINGDLFKMCTFMHKVVKIISKKCVEWHW